VWAVTRQRALVLAGLVGFLMLGVSAAVLGPALPEFRLRFHLNVAQGSWLLTVNSGGSVLGVLLGGWANYLRKPKPALIGGSLLVAGGACTLAFGHHWWLALTGSSVLGVGFGLLDFGVLVILAAAFAETGASVITSLSAAFSVGAVIGPVLVSASTHDVRPAFLTLAGLALALALLWTRTPVESPEREATAGVPSAGMAVAFAFLFALYVSLEVGVGSWETTYLRDANGFSSSAAARATSLFFVAITVGRLLGGRIARKVPVPVMVTAAVVLAAVSLAVAGLPHLGLVGFTATGLFLAPIFPASFAWFSRTQPTPIATTLVFAASVLGPTLSAPVIGAATQAFGSAAIPLVLVVVALCDVVAVMAVRHGLVGR
jgi:FHS family glucose/mannose:H+ symporter-like MFS transporter